MSFGYKKVRVIGATSGSGKALSEKLVQNGIPTIIAGRRKDNLDEFIAKHGSDKVQAKVFDVLKLDEVCLCPKRQRKTVVDGLLTNLVDTPIRLRSYHRKS